MGWSIGYDSHWKRDIGYGVPAECDHDECSEEIHRGLAYVCGGQVRGGEDGCGLFMCPAHTFYTDDGVQVCERCFNGTPLFKAKPDIAEWIEWKLTDESWGPWRDENPEELVRMKEQLDSLK